MSVLPVPPAANPEDIDLGEDELMDEEEAEPGEELQQKSVPVPFAPSSFASNSREGQRRTAPVWIFKQPENTASHLIVK